MARRRLLELAAGGVAVGLAGCSAPSAEEAPPGEREYIVGTTSATQDGLDPFAVGSTVSTSRLNLLYDAGGVIDDDPIGFQGRWLQSWELSEDARRVRYTVRDGLEWGAGYGPLTAETYRYNIENVFTAPWAGYTQAGFFRLGGAPIEYERTGRLSFEARLPEPRANFLHEDPVLSAFLAPVDLLEKHGAADGDESTREAIARDPDIRTAAIVGNLGPFTLDSFDQGSRMVCSANPDYYLADTDVEDGAYRDAPAVDGLRIQVFGEQSTAYSALQAGDITTTWIEPRRKAEFDAAEGIQLWTSRFGPGLFWLSLNHRVNGWAPIRESRAVRRALLRLIDRSTLVEDIYGGNANPIDTIHPRWGPYYSDDAVTRYDHDPDRAAELLESGTSADYGLTEDGVFVGPDGEQVTLRVVTRSDNQTGELVGNFVRQALEGAGFAVSVRGLPFSEIVSTYLANSVGNNPNYDGDPAWTAGPFNGGPWDQSISAEPWDLIYGVGISGPIAYAPWLSVEAFIAEQGSFNAFGYRTDGFDFSEAVAGAASAETRAEASAILEDLFGFLSTDVPLLWTINNHVIRGYRDVVTGLPEARNFFSSPDVRRVSLAGDGLIA